MINTASSNHTRIDANKTTATTAKVVQPVQGRRGRGRTSRAAMKKNKGPCTTLQNKSTLGSTKKNINVMSSELNNVTISTVTMPTFPPKTITTTTMEKEPPDWNHVAHNDLLPSDQSGGYQGLPANQDNCNPEHEMLWFDDMMKDPHDDQWFSTSSNYFGDHQLMVDDDDQHEYDQLWMGMCGSTGGEEQEILSWLWESDDDSFEEAQQSGKAELDSEKQEAMVAWLLS